MQPPCPTRAHTALRWAAALLLWSGPALSCSSGQQAPTLAEIAQQRVRVVDLGYPLNADNAFWPGDRYTPFGFETIAELDKDGVFSGAFRMPEHLGTHLDAPNHFVGGAAAVDRLSLPQLVAPLRVVDVRDPVAQNADYTVTVADLTRFESAHGPVPQGAVVFAFTGWGERWGDRRRYENRGVDGKLHFPGFSAEAARYLAQERSVRGLGIDTLSVDPGVSTDFPVHHILGQQGGFQIENAAHLSEVPPAGAWVLVAPIKIEGGSGGPARVWAVFR